MEIFAVILLIVMGIVLVIVEFMFIPGLSIAGVGSLISFGLSVFFAFRYFGSLAGYIVLISILIFVPLFLYFLFKGKAMKPIMLNTDIDGKVKNFDENKIKIGDEGITTSRLAPSGNAKINGETMEARTLGNFINPHTKIRVLKIEGNTVYVEPIK
jgi:membrane-bound ClpP family serine protease